MNIEQVRDYLLSLPAVEEVEQFEGVIVYKVASRWFAVYMFPRREYLAVKCDPDRAMVLRDKYEAVTPAYHFNKRHWNDLRFTALAAETVMREIRHSYLSVIRKNVTPKALRLSLLAAAEAAGITDATDSDL